jgi:hypothetical protein
MCHRYAYDSMAIRRRKVGKAVYLEEYRSYREKGRVKTEFVRYLGLNKAKNLKPLLCVFNIWSDVSTDVTTVLPRRQPQVRSITCGPSTLLSNSPGRAIEPELTLPR